MVYSLNSNKKYPIQNENKGDTLSAACLCVCYPSAFQSVSVPASCRSLLYWQVICLCPMLAVSVTNYRSLCLSFLCRLSVGSAD